MSHPSLEAALLDLEKHGMLLRIREEVSPDLLMPKMAEIATKESMPALLFERVKGSPFRAAANIFGTMERARFLFRKTNHPVFRLFCCSSIHRKGKIIIRSCRKLPCALFCFRNIQCQAVPFMQLQQI